jgi:Zn-dependent M28 family amino/carboxypeptidase
VPGGLRNVVGSLPGRRPAVVIAAHYDTKDLPGFVGANDGAGGTAAVVELARDLARGRHAGDPELRFVLFDGEESPRASPDSAFLRDGLRGSKAYAARHHDVRAMVLLDFVANPGLRLPREDSSDPALWGRLRSAARRAGVAGAFPPGTQPTVYDDHTPFLQRGVPAIDLIDFDYACFHRTCDDGSQLSQSSLDAVGEAMLELLPRL